MQGGDDLGGGGVIGAAAGIGMDKRMLNSFVSCAATLLLASSSNVCLPWCRLGHVTSAPALVCGDVGYLSFGLLADAFAVLCCAVARRYGENPHQAAAFYVDESLAEAGQVTTSFGGFCWGGGVHMCVASPAQS